MFDKKGQYLPTKRQVLSMLFFGLIIIVLVGIDNYQVLNPKTDYVVEEDITIVNYSPKERILYKTYKRGREEKFYKGELVKVNSIKVIDGEVFYHIFEKQLLSGKRNGLVKPEDVEKRFKDSKSDNEMPKRRVLYYGDGERNTLTKDEIIFD